MMNAFSVRMDRYQDELKWLFFELYPGDLEGWEALLSMLKEAYRNRPANLKKRDELLLNNPAWYKKADMQRFIGDEVMVAELALWSPETPGWFGRKAAEFLEKTTAGAVIVCLSGAETLFQIPGTGWQNENRLHSLIRMFRIVNDLVCPGVLLLCKPLGNGSSCFGSPDKPECHLVEDLQFIPTFWHTLATKDVRLLDRLENRLAGEAKRCTYLRDLREGFTWQLDFDYLEMLNMKRESHLDFLEGFYRNSKKSDWKAEKSEDGRMKILPKNEDAKKAEELLAACLRMTSGIALGTEKDRMDSVRAENCVFDADADIWTVQTDNSAVFGMGRYKNGHKLYGFFNFSGEEQIFSFRDSGSYVNVLTGKSSKVEHLARLAGYGFAWLKEKPVCVRFHTECVKSLK